MKCCRSFPTVCYYAFGYRFQCSDTVTGIVPDPCKRKWCSFNQRRRPNRPTWKAIIHQWSNEPVMLAHACCQRNPSVSLKAFPPDDFTSVWKSSVSWSLPTSERRRLIENNRDFKARDFMKFTICTSRFKTDHKICGVYLPVWASKYHELDQFVFIPPKRGVLLSFHSDSNLTKKTSTA
jgi:hypothetical protein